VAAPTARRRIALMTWPKTRLGIQTVCVVLIGLGLGVAALPLAAQVAPPAKFYRIGVLWPGGSPPPGSRMDWFRAGLSEFGYVEGKNVAIDLRYAETGERLHALAGELTQSNVSVIATFGDLAPTMAQQATTTIPIVAMADDFVGAGLAPSLGRPRGNLTGVTILSPELSAKRLAVLKELIPKVSRVAVLWDPANRSQLTAAEEAARLLSVKLQVLEVRGRDDLPRAFQAAKNGRAQALNVFASPLLSSLQQSIMDLAASHRLPAIYQWKEHADAGGLVSYGPSLEAMWRQTAHVVAKVLNGVSPASLPIEQPTRFELVINMRTARALGLTIPPAIRIRADQTIE
jgi:putative tryptophan/tyrosine transport system substrate-binding protein